MDAREQKRWEDFDFAHMHDPYHVPTTIMGKWAHDMAQTANRSATGGWGGGGTSGGGTAPAGGGVVDGLVDLSDWLIQRIWPLKLLLRIGVRLADSRWKIKGLAALLGAVVFPTLIAGMSGVFPELGELAAMVAGDHAQTALIGAGALSGWFLVPLTGILLVLAIALTGLVLTLAILAAVVFIGWILLTG